MDSKEYDKFMVDMTMVLQEGRREGASRVYIASDQLRLLCTSEDEASRCKTCTGHSAGTDVKQTLDDLRK